MIKKLRHKIAMVLFWLSSILKARGKLVIQDRTIVADCLGGSFSMNVSFTRLQYLEN